MSGIRILDVIAKPYADWSKTICYSLIVDRMPKLVYERTGNSLVSHDDGVYDFLAIESGTKDAFGGREFDIALTDGTVYRATGDVWSVAPPKHIEPTVSVGIGTLHKLQQCYVFSGASVAVTKLQSWLDANTPSNDYYKYDARSTVEWLQQHRDGGARKVCANRARKLRRRGVEVWRSNAGDRMWSPWFERRRAELTARRATDPGTVRIGDIA
ncbi:hypothetical protein ACN9MB_13275 [Dyella kyungheensis]|uniref:hypothetical protein n=1 Tax=Dyella kyungheensis TaxID=1242174 RepID=UPI003CF2CC6D